MGDIEHGKKVLKNVQSLPLYKCRMVKIKLVLSLWNVCLDLLDLLADYKYSKALSFLWQKIGILKK